jgi:beta-galactosidase/beta-glucuronidase
MMDQRGRVIDKVLTPFGFRTFNFDADKGFSLNGKHMKLRGCAFIKMLAHWVLPYPRRSGGAV